MEIISNAKLLAINSDLLNIRVICDMILTVESSEGRKKSCSLVIYSSSFPRSSKKNHNQCFVSKNNKIKIGTPGMIMIFFSSPNSVCSASYAQV